ncbi:flagellar biosynthesis anti-sigma factor FlgM [Sporolactobacillus terrae]|uniref:flagellar biosynthesis anti-sigma factor FlgM n=1 Tax=Sporolactobacillus terrae TaxID=269673 RepID=UPI000491D6E1|nr:flagellar biosynthesis anti-sigma factor FlgM [Sporolactobacillus terrae]UAK16731.1 flagellar biosynthesis anti-sigma factor FlgM [Sporolactobacillus terrae]
MKINRYQPIQNYTTNYQAAKRGETPSKTRNTSDKVEISPTAKRLQGTDKLERARQEKVERLKQQIENGTYQVSSKSIAEKMYGFWNNK